MDATVYIPTLNGGDRLLRTVRTLADQSHIPHVVIVDNGSSDGSIEAARSEVPEIEVFALGANLGFGAALNRAVRRRRSRNLLFLNNDVTCGPTFVEAMLDELGSRPVMVAGVLLQGAKPELIDSAGVVVDSTLMGFDYLHGSPAETLIDAPPPIGPTGGAALFRFDTFEAVGGFDDRIFAYLEDVDLVLRLRYAGVECRLARHACALHMHSATLGSGSARKNWYMGWSRGYLLRRYGVLSDPRRAARALAAEAIIAGGQALLDGTLTGASGRVQGWRAAAGLPVRPIPERDLLDITLRDALARRSRRRSFVWRDRPDTAA